MESVDYWADSQCDSVVEFDAHMNAFVKDSICLNEEEEEHVVQEEEEHVVEEDPREKARNKIIEEKCMIVDDTFDVDDQMVYDVAFEEEEHVVEEDPREKARNKIMEEKCMIVDDTFDVDDQMVYDVAFEEEEVPSMVGNGKNAEVKMKDEAIQLNASKEIVVIDDDDDIVVIDDDDDIVVLEDEDIMVIDDAKIVVIDEEVMNCDEDGLLASNGKQDRDFDLNKLPLSGMLKFSDPAVEKQFIQMLRKYQSKYY